VGIATGAAVMYLRSGTPTPFDDQPPIIVSDGSVYFEGGDKYNPNKGNDAWTQDSTSKQLFHAINSNGFKVQSFTAYVAGVADPNCQQTTLAGDAIEIDYHQSSSTTWKFKIQHGDDQTTGHHIAPQVDGGASDLAGVATGAGAPPQLVADKSGQGWISSVSALDANGNPIPNATCALPKPTAENKSLVRITVVPERH
jgi:hypothetical protein